MSDDLDLEEVRTRLLVIEEAWLKERKVLVATAMEAGRIALLPQWTGPNSGTVFEVRHNSSAGAINIYASITRKLEVIFPSMKLDQPLRLDPSVSRFVITSSADRVLFALLERA